VRVDVSQWPTISRLLDEYLDLPVSEKSGWFARLRLEMPNLEPQIRFLLDAENGAETRDFLPPLESITGHDDYRAGTSIAGYRLVRELGRGGMGAVWLADGSGQLSKRPVALKLPITTSHRKALAQRFARERDILAALTHPHIARLYDAGIAADGQPFLAMEYVEGVPLTEFCTLRRSGLEERLRLFSQVLAAVQYAHANLILHRDLKPSNILVTTGGEVRLLDFGIAKLMVAGEAKMTELTQLGGHALTPDYASPEQIIGATLSTTSDVYSLGVLLYELLTGTRPYRLARDSRAALEEAILKTDPVRPSQAVSEAQSEIVGLSARKFRRLLAGDLDTITLKALKKQPAERYASAEAFLSDLERYRVGAPVSARPDGRLYRLGKFVARNRLAAGAALLIAITLIGATWISLWQAAVARAHASRAQVEATRAQAVQTFLLDIFRTNSHLQKDPIKARQTTARDLLDVGANRVGEVLKGAPAAQAEVLTTLADMYTQMGLDHRAAELRLQRIDALKNAVGPNNTEVADALLDYELDIADTPERSNTLPALKEARRILDAAGDNTSETRAGLWLEYSHWLRYTAPEQMQPLAAAGLELLERYHRESGSYLWALAYVAQASAELGEFEAAEGQYSKMLTEVRLREPADSAWETAPLSELAGIRWALLKIDEAEHDYRTSLDLSRKLNGESHRQTLQSMFRLGALLHATARIQEGARLQSRAVAAVDEDSARNGPEFRTLVRDAYGRSLLAEGRLEAAEPYLAAGVETLRNLYPASILLAQGLLRQAGLSAAQGRYEAAESALTEALSIRRRVGGKKKDPALENPYLIETANLALVRGRTRDAIELAQAVKTNLDYKRAQSMPDDAAANRIVAAAARQEGRLEEAVESARSALDAVQRSAVRKYFETLEADAALALGDALRGSANPRLARQHLERALELRTLNQHARSPWLAEAQIALAECLLDLGERPAAMRLFREANAAHASHMLLGEQFRAPLRELARRLQ
jgi:serine/threonine-protein kinase